MRSLVIAAVLALPAIVVADALDDRMKAEADAMNRRAPMMVDRATRLDAAGYGNRLLFQHFTAMDHSSTDSPAVLQRYATQVREQVTQRACTDEVLKPSLDAGVTVKYVHFGRDHRRISEVEITARACARPVRAATLKKPEDAKTSPERAKPSPRPSVLKKGDTYEKVMERMGGAPSKRNALGGLLTVEFTDPSVIAHPGAKGVCRLSFTEGVLHRCEGCKAGRFVGCGR